MTLTNKFYKTETIIKLKDKPCNFDGYVWKINIREKIITLKVFNECKILNNF